MHPPADIDYDVIVLGGAFSGASAAFCLLRDRPDLKVLIVERSAEFNKRVGEATVEVSGYFLTHVLGMTEYLNREHIVKQGFRFWFSRDGRETFDTCSEIGAKYLVRVPSFQIDRVKLDEEILRRAVDAGAELQRPVHASRIELDDGGAQTVTLRDTDRNEKQVRARWVIDATGHRATLSRQLGWWRANVEHPTTAVWARWTDVAEWDGLELAQKYPQWSKAAFGMRGPATNHLMGDGWWAWFIPLATGETSIGVVYDQRHFDWPKEGSLGDQLRAVLESHPVGREMIERAQPVEHDVHLRRNLPYTSRSYAGDGYALVGDAAAFIDPFYSPGLDNVSYTVWSVTQMVLAERRGEAAEPLVEAHNQKFRKVYDRWFRSLWLDKYELIGDFDLMTTAFILDLGLYYMGLVAQPFRMGPKALADAPFSAPASTPFYHLMRFYNRRLVKMARARKARGVYGKHNAGRRRLLDGFTFGPMAVLKLLGGLLRWGRMELTEGWRSWFRYNRPAAAVEAEASPTARATEASAPEAPPIEAPAAAKAEA